jgi:hypothetical protein
MSEKNKHSYYVAAGVFKVDYKAAGYPDLHTIAKEWAKDANFHELIVRKVSEDNFGIQFVYISSNPDQENIKKYKQELLQKYPKDQNGGMYAWDYNESKWFSDEENPTFNDMIVVLKGIENE